MTDPAASSIRAVRARLPRWLVLMAVALLVRALTFGNPILHIDEEFYFAAARAIAQGAIPYVDVWDRKPVGLFLLYVPAAALGLPLGTWAYQALALACVSASAMLIARLADRAGWAKGALPAAIAYLVWLNLLEGEGGQTPVLYTPLIVGAASLLAPRLDDAAHPLRRFGHGCAALALVGLALQIKYTVVFEGLFFGLWWMVREGRLGRPVWQVALFAIPLAVLAALPTLAAWGWFWAHGFGDAFFYANFASIGARGSDPVARELGNLALMALIVSPLAAMAILAARLPRTAAAGHLRLWLFAWAIVATLGVLLFRGYFDHYALPLLAPFCVCAAGFLADHRRAARVRAPVLIVALIASQLVLLVKRHERGTPAQITAIVQAIGHGPGCLYVFSGSPMLYPMADRCTLTRYRFPRHIGQAKERGAIGVDQRSELVRIMALRAAVVVLGPTYSGERSDQRALVERSVAARYRLRADLPLGRGRIAVYALR